MNSTLVKTLSWGLCSTCLALCTSYIVFGTIFGSMQLVVLDATLFPILYFAHEKWWSKRRG